MDGKGTLHPQEETFLAVRFQVPVHSPAPRISLFLVCKDNADGAGQSREAGELALLCSVTWRGAQLAPEELCGR